MVKPYIPPESSFDTSIKTDHAGWGAAILSSNEWAQTLLSSKTEKESKVADSG